MNHAWQQTGRDVDDEDRTLKTVRQFLAKSGSGWRGFPTEGLSYRHLPLATDMA